MPTFFTKNNHILGTLSGSLFSLSFLLIILEIATPVIVSRFVYIDILPFLVFFFGFSWLFFYIKPEEDYYKQRLEPIFKYIFLCGLLLIMATSLNFEFIASIPFLKVFVDFLSQYTFVLSFVVIGSGFFTFYFNRSVIGESTRHSDSSSCHSEQSEESQEELAEQKRLKDFPVKHPKINKIPVLRSVVRWMYKEGWGYSIGLLVLLIIGFMLRIWNLTILDPYSDEYAHLVAAKEYFEAGTFEYARAKVVTYLVAFFYWIGNASSFYEYVYWGRIPGVIFNTLTAIPIYFLAKKISKTVGIISILLWITSPWAIGVAKTVREYAFYPLFVLVLLIIILRLLEMLTKYRHEHRSKILLCTAFIMTFFAYAFLFDPLSTLKISAVVVFPVALYLLILYRQTLRTLYKEHNKSFWVGFLFFVSASMAAILYGQQSGQVTLQNITLDSRWLNYFVNSSSPMHWWTGTSFGQFATWFFTLLGATYAFVKKKYHFFLYLLIFSAILLFFLYFFDRYLRPRYIFYTLPFFSILIATSIYALIDPYKRLLKHKSKFQKIAVIIIFLLFFSQVFSYQNIIYPATSNTHGYVKTTNEHHDKLKSAIEFFGEQDISEEDIFIATIFRHVLYLEFDIPKEKQHQYVYRDESRFDYIESLVTDNNSGWMILDWRRNGYWVEGYPKKGNFTIGNKAIEVIQNKEGIQIYRWR